MAEKKEIEVKFLDERGIEQVKFFSDEKLAEAFKEKCAAKQAAREARCAPGVAH